MHNQKSKLIILILALLLCFTSCSANKSCYNKDVNTEKYSRIKNIPNISFEVLKNGSMSLDESLGLYFNRLGAVPELETPVQQEQVLWELYVDGVYIAAKNGYVLLDRDSYIVFTITNNSSLKIGNIQNNYSLIKTLNEKTNNYFNFAAFEDKKIEFYSEHNKIQYKVIGSVKASLPFLPNTALSGYASILENADKQSVIMVVLTDKAFTAETKKEMRYITNSLVFNKDSKGFSDNVISFEPQMFKLMQNKQNVLFSTTQPIKSKTPTEQTHKPIGQYKFLSYTNIEQGEETYDVLSLNKGERYTSENFVYSEMDNLLFSSGIYALPEDDMRFYNTVSNPENEEETITQLNKSYCLSFIKDRVQARVDAFVLTLYSSPSTYSHISSNGVFKYKDSIYSIITYNYHRNDTEYPCIEIYKEDLTQDRHIVSYNISYKPLAPASSDSTAAYNEIMQAIGLKK